MAIVINGSGTVTGLAVGGLPDGTVDAGTLATDSVTAAKLEVSAITGADLPAGSVLQVVQQEYATGVNQGGTSYADTGTTATITPSSTSSKILILVSQPVFNSVDTTSNRTSYFRLYRDIGSSGSELEVKEYSFIGSPATYDTSYAHAVNYLDSPSSTAAVTYRTQFKLSGTTADVKVNDGGGSSNITLMEIAG
tara:strand:- start:158 stop:739 length:582 start_codon:yes stop_codon:yes gene_type:complete